MTKGYLAALQEARAGLEQGGIPIGAALEQQGQVIGRGHNLRVQEGDPTAHAEISCLRNAGRLRSYSDTVLYTTLAPCSLCAGAILLFGIPRVVIGETHTFNGEGSLALLRAKGVETENLDDQEARRMLASFVKDNQAIWNEDIGR
ncbi:MAG: nucleoside deaminase [Solirubrobacteraceae bacterium]